MCIRSSYAQSRALPRPIKHSHWPPIDNKHAVPCRAVPCMTNTSYHTA